MSTNDRTIAILTQLALATDGAVAGLALAYAAIQSWRNYKSTSSAHHKISGAPTVPIADLRTLITSSSDESEPSNENLVVLRGTVEAKSAVDGNWRSLRPNVLLSHDSGEKGVILQRTQTCIYNEWKGLFGWTSDIRALLGKSSWKHQKSTSIRTVPFILVESGAHSDYVIVNIDGSIHPLPLTTVYHQLQPVQASPYTFIQAMFGHPFPVGLLDEEKILPLGKEISAIGICTSQDGIPQIKSCEDLPYFLSDMTKDQILVDLAYKTNIFFWSAVILGSVSLGILGYALTRNWQRWKEWRQQRQVDRSRDADASPDAHADEDNEDIPDGHLCVICLMRRRRSAFVPCGHLVCCHRCALSVERDSAPKCPVCRQTIRNSVRIYDS